MRYHSSSVSPLPAKISLQSGAARWGGPPGLPSSTAPQWLRICCPVGQVLQHLRLVARRDDSWASGPATPASLPAFLVAATLLSGEVGQAAPPALARVPRSGRAELRPAELRGKSEGALVIDPGGELKPSRARANNAANLRAEIIRVFL